LEAEIKKPWDRPWAVVKEASLISFLRDILKKEKIRV